MTPRRWLWLLLVVSTSVACGDDRGDPPPTGSDAGGRIMNAFPYGPTRTIDGYVCREDEVDRTTTSDGRLFTVCIPDCDTVDDCPAAPDGATASPACEPISAVESKCELRCTMDSECPAGTVCVPSDGNRFCAYEQPTCSESMPCAEGQECRSSGAGSFCRYPL